MSGAELGAGDAALRLCVFPESAARRASEGVKKCQSTKHVSKATLVLLRILKVLRDPLCQGPIFSHLLTRVVR